MDIPAQQFAVLPELVPLGPAEGFRPGTSRPVIRSRFVLTDCGMGDYICFMSAITWIAENCPWVRGEVICEPCLIPLFSAFLFLHPKWKVLSGERFTVREDEHFVAPGLEIEGAKVFNQYLGPTGSHLVDLGFAWYVGMTPAPPGACYPRITQPAERLPRPLRGQVNKYAVFTPGSVTSSRRVTGKHLNPLLDYVTKLGLTPVILGRSNRDEVINPFFPTDLRYDLCLDLRDKTTVLDAACIMEHAAFTLGLDNGLLHLAATTPGAVIFGYNIAGPMTRRPRRSWGLLQDVTLTSEELPCNHCQDKWKVLLNHSFHKCFYGDTKCIDMLFADEGARWKRAIEKILAETKEGKI